MRAKQSFMLLTLLLFLLCFNNGAFAQNRNNDTVSTRLIFTNENGFITKDIGVTFLIANSLIDTTKNKKEWKEINQNDTIGRYYRIDSSNNYLMCLPYSLNSFNLKILLIKINSNGKLVKSEKYDFGSAHVWNSYYKDFDKFGGFFSIIAQGGFGCGQYYCMKLYLFKELFPQDSINYIRLQEQKIMYKNNSSNKEIIKSYWSSIEIHENTLIIHYKLHKGKVKIKKNKSTVFKFCIFGKKSFTVKYLYENGKWSTNDEYHLKEIEQYMEVKPYQIKI